jgi:chain length determinant protein (polysaccharide antigen chain regulator)
MPKQNNTPVSVLEDAGFRDDEINLFDLLTDLQLQKRWFIAPIVCCFLLALLYVSVVTPVYQVQSIVKAADESDLAELNSPQLQSKLVPVFTDGKNAKESIAQAEIFSLNVEDAYKQTTQAFLSREYRRDFYLSILDSIKEYGLYNEKLTEAQNFNSFNELFSVSLSNPKKDAEQFVELKLDFNHAENATKLMNDYLTFTLNAKLNSLETTLANKLAARIESLEYDASLIREKYRTGKTYRKLLLDEASGIAQKIGQSESVYSKNGILADTADLPLYLYGSKALIAESNALSNREKLSKNLPFGEEHFINGLPEILFEIQQLKNLKIDFSKVSIAKIDEFATVPVKPIKPRKALILALGLIAGGFLGLMTALIVGAYKRHKKQHELVELE